MSDVELKVVSLSLETIRERPGNARIHTRKQLLKLQTAIRTFGFVVPVLVDNENVLIAGHGRVEAARREGLGRVPAIYVRHLSPEQIRALTIADNRITELASWDKKLLAKELTALVDLLPMPEVMSTGFELEEIERLQDVAGSCVPQEDEAMAAAISRSTPATTRLGDCWIIGEHRLLCGDSLQTDSYVNLLGRDRAGMVITDPPWNRRVDGEISGLGRTRHPEFVMASGELSRTEFQRFLATMCMHLARFSRSGSLHYIFIDWRSIADLLAAGEAHYDALLNVIIWVKSNGGGMGSFYRSQHELVALFKRGKRAHTNNVALGANGRNRTNVWQYPGANSAERRADLALHPTVKNLEMITEAIRDASECADLVLDPFAGSGTTLLAAERSGRRARLIELDPHYCDLVVTRAQTADLGATLLGTGQPYGEVAECRLADVQNRPDDDEQAR